MVTFSKEYPIWRINLKISGKKKITWKRFKWISFNNQISLLSQ